MDDEIPIRSYTDLDVWKVSVALAGICYRLTKVFPDEERYGMTSQIRRASTSIAANIAEGYGRNQVGQFIQFLRIAQGSARELETHFVIAQEIGLLTSDAAHGPKVECDRVCRMLRALIRSLETKTRGA
jgi:four helix bundle protein